MVVLITGASSGLGCYTAQAFRKNGHIVYGTSRNVSSVKENMQGINFIELDVCSDASCEKAVKKVIEKEGRIDILVNNAGMGIAGALEMTSVEEAKVQFETNFFGILRMCKMVLPYMRKEKRGMIINVSSVAAVVPIPFQSMYSAGKAAVESISHALAMETKEYGIRVSAIEFGDMKTEFTKNRRITEESVTDEKSGIYDKTFKKSLKTMENDERNGPVPEKAAKLILKTAMKKNPKPIIVCGGKYKAIVMMRRLLPMRISNYIIGKIYA